MCGGTLQVQDLSIGLIVYVPLAGQSGLWSM